MAAKSKSKAIRTLEKIAGPLTFGRLLWAIRSGEEMTLAAFATPLGVTRQRLNDIEKGRVSVSAARAAEWAEILGYPVAQFVRLALQAQIEAGGLVGLQVEVTGKLRKAG
jgi:transcriptional regulator with XRE-family HTH domain